MKGGVCGVLRTTTIVCRHLPGEMSSFKIWLSNLLQNRSLRLQLGIQSWACTRGVRMVSTNGDSLLMGAHDVLFATGFLPSTHKIQPKFLNKRTQGRALRLLALFAIMRAASGKGTQPWPSVQPQAIGTRRSCPCLCLWWACCIHYALCPAHEKRGQQNV